MYPNWIWKAGDDEKGAWININRLQQVYLAKGRNKDAGH